MTYDHSTAANHAIEAVHRVMNDKAKCRPVRKTLFLQVDNCSLENKSKYSISYMEFLLQLVVLVILRSRRKCSLKILFH